MMQIFIPIPLMHDWRQSSIPIRNIVCLRIVIAPFRQWFRPEGTQIINNTTTLDPDCQTGNGSGVGQFVTVIQIIVKSLITSSHANFRFILFVNFGTQILFHGHCFTHGRSGTNGWFLTHRIQYIQSVSIFQPIRILGRFAQPSRISIFTKKVQLTT